MASRTPFYMDPTVSGAACANHPNRWSPSNPAGIRCTLQDFNIAVFGPRDMTGYAKTPHDNVGIQYGFRALNAGQVTVEQVGDQHRDDDPDDSDHDQQLDKREAVSGAQGAVRSVGWIQWWA